MQDFARFTPCPDVKHAHCMKYKNPGRFAPNPLRPDSRFAPIPVHPDSLSPSFINTSSSSSSIKV
jgi:hypothetical protein